MAISYVFNPFTGTMAPVSVETVNLGGVYGLRKLNLTGHITLTPGTDLIYQYLHPNGSNRDVTLDEDAATTGDRFIVRNNTSWADYRYLKVKSEATEIDKIYGSRICKYIYDGSNWVAASVGSGEEDARRLNIGFGRGVLCYENAIAIGDNATGRKQGICIGRDGYAHNYGVAVGGHAQAYDYGVAMGRDAIANTYGVAIGHSAAGDSYGVALGRLTDTNAKRYAIALGYYSETERVGELAINIGSSSTQIYNKMIAGWAGSTANDTPLEIYCAAYGTNRFTIRASSALTFKIMVTARDNTSGDCAAYIFDGLIKRDGAGNTTMSVCNKTVTHEDDATWDCDVTADDTNEALIITVTGDADNTVRWAARLDGVETHF